MLIYFFKKKGKKTTKPFSPGAFPLVEEAKENYVLGEGDGSGNGRQTEKQWGTLRKNIKYILGRHCG